jgi:acyl-coenzyme A thioesterase 13
VNVDDLRTRLETRATRGGWGIDSLEVVSLDPGHVVMRLTVDESLVNMAQTLHGGAAATLVDVVGTIAIITADEHHRPGVSTDLNVTWLAAAPLGDVVLAEATVLKTGRTMAFVSVDLRRESDGKLLVQGRMTKSLGPIQA